MTPSIIFDVNEFFQSVNSVKNFWLKSKLNKLRIVAHKNTQNIDFISIDRNSGLETVATVSGFVQSDFVLYAKTVISVYEAADLLQKINVGEKKSLKVRLVPSLENKNRFSLEVLLRAADFAASEKSF